MAYQIFNSDWVGNGLRADLSTTDDMYVKAGVIVGREDALVAGDYTVEGTGSNHYVEIDGRVTGGGCALRLGDSNADDSNVMKIGGTGVVQSLTSLFAIVLNGSNARIENAGRIEAHGDAVRLTPQMADGSSVVENNGTIEAGNRGIVRSGGTQDIQIFNRGLLDAYDQAFLSLGTAVDKIYNTGTIRGSIELAGGDDLYDGRGGVINGAVDGGAGNDRMFGGNGNEAFIGGDGNDDMRGGRGNDFYFVDSAGDAVIELAGQGIDRVYSYTSRTLGANVENLQLLTVGTSFGNGNSLANKIDGSSTENTLRGLAGKDTLFGDKGDDMLVGGAGADKLTGGLDADKFTFNSVAESRAAGGIDRIMDFSRAQKDKIALSAIDANTTKAGNQAFSFIGTKAFSGKAGELRYQKSGSDSVVAGDVNGDGKADFTVISDAAVTFLKGDFIL
jgi:Ca2+-binding RTX toxin-like protein